MSRPFGMGLLAGVGTGLVLASGTLLALFAAERGLEGRAAFLAWLGLFTAGFGLMLMLAPWVFAEPQEHAAPPATKHIAAPPTAQPITVIRRVGGTHMGRPHEIDIEETRPTTWGAWQVAALTWLDWHTRRRSLTRDALTGPGLAFGKPADWVEFTDELARVGLANKENGKTTVLALPLPVVRDRITRGVVEWRTDVAPPAIAPPYPAGGVVLEAEKV